LLACRPNEYKHNEYNIKPQPVALVTGASQGIGLETCRQLKAAGFYVILTSRSESAGRAAADDLSVAYHQLDVTSSTSIAALAADLSREGRRLDLLVNNAGISMEGFNSEVVRGTLAVNFFGSLNVTEALLPLIADGGAIVMVSSGVGELHAYSPAIRARFADPALTRRWRTADEAGRRAMLPTLAGVRVDIGALGGPPKAIDSLEWFASTDDMVRVMEWLRSNGDPETLAILAINPGIGSAASHFAYLGYKGGSETGVIAMTFLLRREDGGWREVSASWNNPAAPVDEARFGDLVGRLVALQR